MNKILAVLAVLVYFAIPAQCQDGGAFGGFVSLSVDTVASTSIVNIPESARTVLTHPDDTYYSKERIARVIPYADVNTPGGFQYTGALGADCWLGRFVQLRAAGTASIFMVSGDVRGDTLREWGQFENNDNRGYGTSLVYYRVTSPTFVPGAFADITVGSSRSPVRLIAGYAYSYTGLDLETGWDRYDALEKHQVVPIRSASGDRAWTRGPYGGVAIRLSAEGRRSPMVRCTVGKMTRPQLDFGTAQLAQTSSYAVRVEFVEFFGH